MLLLLCAHGITPCSACCPLGVKRKGSLSLQPFANLPQAQLMNCISAVHEISAERKAWGWGAARGKLLRIYSLVLTGASWHPVSEGNLTKHSRQLILNLTSIICFLRGQESADLSLFRSPLGLNYKHGMWVGQMVNSPAGEG